MSGEDVRDELVEVLADELFRRWYGRDEVPESFDQSRKHPLRKAAECVLASDHLAEYVTTKQRDTIDLLGARLDQMRAEFPPSLDPLSRAFDDGWNGARLQIGPNILDPKIAAHIRANMPKAPPS